MNDLTPTSSAWVMEQKYRERIEWAKRASAALSATNAELAKKVKEVVEMIDGPSKISIALGAGEVAHTTVDQRMLAHARLDELHHRGQPGNGMRNRSAARILNIQQWLFEERCR